MIKQNNYKLQIRNDKYWNMLCVQSNKGLFWNIQHWTAPLEGGKGQQGIKKGYKDCTNLRCSRQRSLIRLQERKARFDIG